MIDVQLNNGNKIRTNALMSITNRLYETAIHMNGCIYQNNTESLENCIDSMREEILLLNGLLVKDEWTFD